MNNLDKIFSANPSSLAFSKAYLSYLAKVLTQLDAAPISQMIEVLLEARKTGNRIFFIGNGGSAATASHFANDLAIGPRCPSLPFKAIALTDNVAVITAIGNDFGYEDIFFKQLEVVMEPGDVVVAISASGNSPNLIKAVEYAHSKGNKTIGLVGFDGGRLKDLCSLVVHVPTPGGEYGPVEDTHMVIDHLINSYFIRLVKNL